MVTCCCPLGDRLPLGGVKVAPTSLFAVQVIPLCELESSVRVTVQVRPFEQLLASRAVGLTDHVGGGTDVGVGIGVGGTGVDGMARHRRRPDALVEQTESCGIVNITYRLEPPTKDREIVINPACPLDTMDPQLLYTARNTPGYASSSSNSRGTNP